MLTVQSRLCVCKWSLKFFQLCCMFEHFHNKMLVEMLVSISNFMINCQPVPPWSKKRASVAPPTRDPAVEWHWPKTPSLAEWPPVTFCDPITESSPWIRLSPARPPEWPREKEWARFTATHLEASQLVLAVKKIHLPVQETWIRPLGREDPLEKEVATHSSILAWRIPMDRGAWRASVHGVAKSQTWLSH